MNRPGKEREEKLRRQLGRKAEIPEAVSYKISEAYGEIENRRIPQKRCCRGWARRTAVCAGILGAAAVIVCVIGLGNPVLATRLPLVGGLFERLQDKVSFFGDFSDKAQPLEEPAPSQFQGEEIVKDEGIYRKTDDGLTITFSEVYANDQAIYLTMLAESEEPFPDTGVVMGEGGSQRPAVSLIMKKNYDFMGEVEDPGQYLNPEGVFLDEKTYTSIVRLNLAEDSQGYGGQGQVDIPDDFMLHLEFVEFIGVRRNFVEEQHYRYEGSWDFEIPIHVDRSLTVIQELNDTNDQGVGIASVVKTPYEITLNELYAEGANRDTMIVALDARGNKLPYINSEGNVNVFAIQDRDISTVDIYILDYVQYMDELKGEENYNNNENKPEEEKWSTLLEQNAIYHTTVHFE